MNSQQIASRRKARKLLLQALYQWQMTKADLTDIEQEFHEIHDMSQVDTHYFHEGIHQIPQQSHTLDEYFKPYLDRSVEELGAVELCLLRIGCYELMKRSDIPYRVSINEAVELAKSFGANESHKYINGILDKVSTKHRDAEK